MLIGTLIYNEILVIKIPWLSFLNSTQNDYNIKEKTLLGDYEKLSDEKTFEKSENSPSAFDDKKSKLWK